MNCVLDDLTCIRLDKNNFPVKKDAYADTEVQDTFFRSLSETQQAAFLKVEQLWCEECAFIEKHAYQKGVRDGVALMVETLQKKE